MWLYWTAAFVVLLLTHKSVALDDDVVIKVKYDSTGVIFYNILFSVEEFKSFHRCLCGGKHCRALYDVGNAPNIDVRRVTEEIPTPAISGEGRFYRCTNSPSTNSLFCERQSQLQHPSHISPQTFKVHRSSCDSTCIVLTRTAANEGIDFNHQSIDAEFCDTDCTKCKPANATGENYNTITAPPLTYFGTGSGFTAVSTTASTSVHTATRHIPPGDTTAHPPGTETVSEAIAESATKDDPDSGINAAVIGGIVLGGIMLIVVVFIFAFVLLRGRTLKKHRKYETSGPQNAPTSPTPPAHPTVEHLGVVSLDSTSPDNTSKLQNGNGVTSEHEHDPEHEYSVILPDFSYIKSGSNSSESTDGDKAGARSSGFHYDVAQTMPNYEDNVKNDSTSDAPKGPAKDDNSNKWKWIYLLETMDVSPSDDIGGPKPDAGKGKRDDQTGGDTRMKPAFSSLNTDSDDTDDGDSLQTEDNLRNSDKLVAADDGEDYGYSTIALDYSIGPYQNVQPESRSPSTTSELENASGDSTSPQEPGRENEDSDSRPKQSHILSDHGVVGSEC